MKITAEPRSDQINADDLMVDGYTQATAGLTAHESSAARVSGDIEPGRQQHDGYLDHDPRG